MSAPSKVFFTIDLLDCGSCIASLSDGVDSISLTASYLSDGLTQLADAVNALLAGGRRSTCAWEEEPGQYRWILERREDDRLQISILWFDQSFSRQPDERGRTLFALCCKLPRFALQVRSQLWKLLTEFGGEGYEQRWRHEFPQHAFERLSELGRGRHESV